MAVVGVVLPQVCWIDALAVPWESPTTGAGLSDLSGADKTAMTFFGLSFTVISRSPGCCAEPVIARTAGCGVGHSSIRAADQPLKQKKTPGIPLPEVPFLFMTRLHQLPAGCCWREAGEPPCLVRSRPLTPENRPLQRRKAEAPASQRKSLMFLHVRQSDPCFSLLLTPPS